MKLIYCVNLIFSLLISSDICASATPDSDTLSVAEMQEIATGILNKLKAAKGILPEEAPTLRVLPFRGSVKIAVMRYEEGLIDLDTRTFKISQTVSKGRDNALSWILGHELGHYTHQHGQSNHHQLPARRSVLRQNTNSVSPSSAHPGFARSNPSADMIDAFVKTSNEAEADFEGAFLGYLAGYEPMEAGKELIEKIYKDSLGGLNDNIPGYPSLADRQKIIEETTSELAKLRPLYESAKYLSTIGQYADAATLLEEVSRKFKSREVYNNLGVLHILHCLQNITDKKVKKYEFPLVYDAEFRGPHPKFEGIERPGEFSHVEGEQRIDIRKYCQKTETQLFVEKAEAFFQKAIAMDPKYPEAHLNLSIAQAIKACLFDKPNCRYEQDMEYTKSEANAFIAQDLAYKALSKPGIYTLEHYDFIIPSDNIVPIPYPTDTNRVNRSFAMMIIFIDSQIVNGVNRIDTSEGRLAIYKEVFGHYDLSLNNQVSLNKTRHTIWGPEDVVPDEAVLLSKIHVQIDLLKVLKNNLSENERLWSVERGDRGFRRQVVPFDRALELDRNSMIAIKNQRQFLNQEDPIVRPTPSISKILKYNSRTIAEIEQQTRSWDIVVSEIDSSRLTSFRSESITFISGEDEKIYFTRVNAQQGFKFRNNPGYKLYVNTASSPIDNRREKSIFLEPLDVESLVFDTNLTITRNMSLDSVVNYLGRQPGNLIPLASGTLASFETEFKQDFYQLLRENGRNARGDTIVQNFRRLIKIDPMELGSIDREIGFEKPTTVDISEHEEHGLILKINKENNVEGYLLYYKSIRTEGGRLHTNKIDGTQTLTSSRNP